MNIKTFNKALHLKVTEISDTVYNGLLKRKAGFNLEDLYVCDANAIELLYLLDIDLLNIQKQNADELYLPFTL